MMKKKTKLKPKPKLTGIHNADWRKNDALIRNAYTEELKKTKRMPTQGQIGEICGLTEKTVRTHLHAIDFNDLIKPFKLYGSDVLVGLYEKAVSGDPAAIKLFMFLIFDKVERKDITAKLDAVVKVKKDVKVTVSPEIMKKIGREIALEATAKKYEQAKRIEKG